MVVEAAQKLSLASGAMQALWTPPGAPTGVAPGASLVLSLRLLLGTPCKAETSGLSADRWLLAPLLGLGPQ